MTFGVKYAIVLYSRAMSVIEGAASPKDVFVVVPSYNHRPYVERCLRSIFEQTRPPKKLLVIDDGSTDGSPALIERVLKDCSFDSELIARENRGLCRTLNQGLERSTGEFFAYIGSDDVWSPQFLESQVNLLTARPNAVLAFGHAYLIDEDDQVFDCTKNWTEFADGDLLPDLLAGQVFSSASVVYRTEAIRQFCWNENSILEDYELYLKLSQVGEFARNKSVVCGWRQHGNNVSADIPRMVEEWIAAQDRVADVLPFSRRELDTLQQQLRFDMVSSFVRSGHRAKAATAFVTNLGGARSPTQIVRLLARIIVPAPLFDANVRRKRRAANRRYGELTFEQYHQQDHNPS